MYCSTARNAPPGSCSCHEEQRGHAPRHRRGQSRHLAKQSTAPPAPPRRPGGGNAAWRVAAEAHHGLHTIRDRTAAAARWQPGGGKVGEDVGGSGGIISQKATNIPCLVPDSIASLLPRRRRSPPPGRRRRMPPPLDRSAPFMYIPMYVYDMYSKKLLSKHVQESSEFF